MSGPVGFCDGDWDPKDSRDRDQMRRYRERMLNPILIVPLSCGTDESAFTSEPGEIIVYEPSGGGRPEFLPIPGLDQRCAWCARKRNPGDATCPGCGAATS